MMKNNTNILENKIGAPSNGMENTTRKRKLQGVVVSDKMAKTAVVAVSHDQKHPKYSKYYRVTQRLKAHDENKEYKVGDKVMIEETRPMSKEKRWKIIGKI